MFVHETADVDASAVIGEGTSIWDYAKIREGVTIGSNCVIGRNVYIGTGVKIGDNCKIQNNALIYDPAELEDGVFVGPGVILTNDKNPGAVNRDGTLKGQQDWSRVGVYLETGSAIGAGSVCVAPVRVGSWATVGALSVVTKNVESGTTVYGNPARPSE